MAGREREGRNAEPRKRHRHQVSEEDTAAQRRTRVRQSVGAAPTLEPQAEAKALITARMPTAALTTDWSVGQNRALNPSHVQRLKKRFAQGGGPKRDAEENQLTVVAGGGAT